MEEAGAVLAVGGAARQGFGNFYALTTRPDAATVRRINLLKGRPPEQVGSAVATPLRISLLYDWAALPEGLTVRPVHSVIDDALFQLGPFGIRGRAAVHVPDHLVHVDGGGRTTQVIAPGYACPSNRLLSWALDLAPKDTYVTSVNRPRLPSGAPDEPAHRRTDGLPEEFGSVPRFVVLAHHDEATARRWHPLHPSMSMTILAFRKVAECGYEVRLVVERHDSPPVEQLRSVVERLGFGLEFAPSGARPPELREYPDVDADSVGSGS